MSLTRSRSKSLQPFFRCCNAFSFPGRVYPSVTTFHRVDVNAHGPTLRRRERGGDEVCFYFELIHRGGRQWLGERDHLGAAFADGGAFAASASISAISLRSCSSTSCISTRTFRSNRRFASRGARLTNIGTTDSNKTKRSNVTIGPRMPGLACLCGPIPIQFTLASMRLEDA